MAGPQESCLEARDLRDIDTDPAVWDVFKPLSHRRRTRPTSYCANADKQRSVGADNS